MLTCTDSTKKLPSLVSSISKDHQYRMEESQGRNGIRHFFSLPFPFGYAVSCLIFHRKDSSASQCLSQPVSAFSFLLFLLLPQIPKGGVETLLALAYFTLSCGFPIPFQPYVLVLYKTVLYLSKLRCTIFPAGNLYDMYCYF